MAKIVESTRQALGEREIATLLAREERMRLALAAGQIYAWEWDVLQGSIVWSEGLERELGTSAPDYASFRKLVHPDDADYVAGRVEAALEGPEDYAAEFRMVRSDGSVRWCSARAIVVRDDDGKALRMVGVDQDVTERHELLRRTTESEARVRAAYGSLAAAEAASRIGSWDWDILGGRVYVSDAYRALYGLDRDVDVTFDKWLELILPEDREKVLRATRAHLETGAPLDIEFRVNHRGSGSRWIAALGEATRDPNGAPTRFAGINIDITERKRRDDVLSQFGAILELQAIYEAAPLGLCVLDLDLRWIRINARMAETNGLAPEVHIGRSVRELTPGIADAVAWAVRQVLETGESFIGELSGETPARPGVRRTWAVTYHPIRASDSDIAAILVIADEITEARVGEEQRRHLFQLIEQSDALIALAAPDRRLTYLNRPGRQMLGLDEDAPLDDVMLGDSVAPAWREAFFGEVMPTVREAGLWVGEMQISNRLTGRIVDVHRSTFALHDKDGRLAGYGAVMRDITEAKTSRAALAENEARLRLAAQAGRVGVFDWNLRTGALTWDDRLRELWALPPGAEVSIDTFFAGLHPEDRAKTEAAIAASTYPSGGGEYAVEYRVIGRVDGVERHIAARGKVLFEDGAAVAMIGLVVDVTAQRMAERVLARDREDLEALVTARTRDLQQTQARLAQAEKLTALGQLASGVAHDFNNILQAVLGGTRLIEKAPNDPDSVRRLARMVLDAADRGSSVSRRLLAVSRQSDLRATPIDVASLLQNMREVLSHTLGAGIVIRVQAPAGLPPMLADKGQLETVLINLAVNARDAMAGKGALTLSADVDRVESGAPMGDATGLSPGSYVRLDVQDTGAGMTPEVLARATDPFFTTKASGEGTGLGLATARGFAEQSGGALTIESAPGEGAVVTLWLPLARNA